MPQPLLNCLLTWLLVSVALLPARAQRLVITPLTGNLYVYTTYGMVAGQPYPGHGLYLVTPKGVVLIDTPWDTTQFQPLLDSIQARHRQPVVLCIATHFHNDRTAGFPYLQQHGIKTYSSTLTRDLCRQHDEPQASHVFTKDTMFIVDHEVLETYYPGEGHTKDNLVIWFPKEKVLYGGCLVKSTDTDNLGNLADANLSAWPATILNVMKRFPHRQYVIPGHQGWSSNQSLEHTFQLLQQQPKP